MKWILINNRRDNIREYHLVDDDHLVMILKFNPETHSVRLNAASNQRLFFLENAGTLTGKYILKNEYGMSIGHLNSDKWMAGGGTVTIDSKKYGYKINNAASAELVIYASDDHRTLLSCELGSDGFLNGPEKLLDTNISSVLLGLCWLITVSAVKKQAYAA